MLLQKRMIMLPHNNRNLLIPAPTRLIDIHFDRNPPGSFPGFQFHDEDDSCMKGIIESFNMGNFCINSDRFFHIPGHQAVFHLANLDSIGINYISDTNAIDVDLMALEFSRRLGKGFVFTACAIESLLKKLHENDCVGKNEVMFQSRKGSIFDKDQKLTGPITISLGPDPQEPARGYSQRDGFISHTYAYLDDEKLCIFFNPMTQEKENNIKSVLKSLFNERQYDPSMEDSLGLGLKNSGS